jgi:putative transposase
MEADRRPRKRCERWNDLWDAHELTFSCFRRKPFLLSDRTRSYLAEAVMTARQKFAFDVWAYAIMPEHMHLLVWPREEVYSISSILQSIKQSVSRRAIGWVRRENPDGLSSLATGQRRKPYRFWLSGGGYDRNIHKSGTIRKVIDYIHANPVRRGLVQAPEQWLWSSFREWTVGDVGPIPIDKESCNRSLV